jgi:hypothetical protein
MTNNDQQLKQRITTLEELVALHQSALEDVARLMMMPEEGEPQPAREAAPGVRFTADELLAIAECFHDAVKDYPNDQLYAAIEAKAERLLASAQAANERNTRSRNEASAR